MNTKSEPQQHQEMADADWEEWDGNSPFWIHCVAGSLAGVVEHAAVFPLDTVRTHIQVCASCIQRGGNNNNSNGTALFKALEKNPSSLSSLRGNSLLKPAAASNKVPMGMWQTMRFLMNEPALVATAAAQASSSSTTAATTTASSTTTTNTAFRLLPSSVQGLSRLWRGVQAILIGCVPAHALYFSSYEVVKAATRDPHNGQVTAWGSSLAGAAAVFGHDCIMTPLDTVKQRMQLGHYQKGVSHALTSIVRQEGFRALYRSFSITLISNVPYGMIMVSTNEFCKQAWESPNVPAWQTVLAASSVGGFCAAALTTPLDRIKTSLQTQALAPVCLRPNFPKENCKLAASQVRYRTFVQAAMGIAKQEGFTGFWRGLTPRVLSHTPAVAISWTTYEMTKNALLRHYNSNSNA